MKTINLDLSEDSAREMLNILFKKKSDLQLQVANVEGEIRKIKQSLGLIKNTANGGAVSGRTQPVVNSDDKLSDGIIQAAIDAVKKTPSGRIRKVLSENIVMSFLKNKNGHGCTIKEITSETGTVYGTVRRILNELKDSNNVHEEEGLWRWGKSEFA
jgi:hypothetical protein